MRTIRIANSIFDMFGTDNTEIPKVVLRRNLAGIDLFLMCHPFIDRMNVNFVPQIKINI